MKKPTVTIAIISFLLGIGVTYLFSKPPEVVESPTTEPIASSQEEDTTKAESALISNDNPFEQIPTIDAYYNGEKMWFIHTDVSDADMAKRLTAMVNFNTIFSSQLGTISKDKVGTLYVFTNGIKQEEVKPWNGGPFGFQIDIFDTIPGMDTYTPIRSPQLVTWKETATPRILKSVDELLEAEQNGEVTIKQTNVIVNVPIIKWPSDYFGGQSKL